ncbi:MAG: hypothetical protein PHT94_04295 [Candidatus Nanoarchaeia archaeon]|nr:hypothetical protein [Candidatus Nanoarchaeia archaeon]
MKKENINKNHQKLKKKSMSQILIATLLFAFGIMITVLFISSDKTDIIPIINNTTSIINETFNNDLNLDLSKYLYYNIPTIVEEFSMDKEKKINELILVNYPTNSILKNFAIKREYIYDKFNFKNIEELISYFQSEKININQIKIEEFYSSTQIFDTIFICNLIVNHESISLKKILSFKDTINKMESEYFYLLKSMSNKYSDQLSMDVYKDKDSFEKIKNKISNYENVEIINPDFTGSNDNEKFKRFYLQKEEFNLKMEYIQIILEELKNKFPEIQLTKEDVYNIISMHYILPCVLFNYNSNDIYLNKNADFYYIDYSNNFNNNDLNDILKSFNGVNISKDFSDFKNPSRLVFTRIIKDDN